MTSPIAHVALRAGIAMCAASLALLASWVRADPSVPSAVTRASARAPSDHDEPEVPPVGPLPTAIWADQSDVRALAALGDSVWVATGGGLLQYAIPTWTARASEAGDGIDSSDIRDVRIESGTVVVRTAGSRCERHGDRFRCRRAAPPPPRLPSGGLFRGHTVTAKLEVAGGTVIGTRGGGTFFVGLGGVRRLGNPHEAPSSAVRSAVWFRGALWLGTFRDGVWRVPPGPAGLHARLAESTRVDTPFRMVNAMAEADGALFVAANEGLFVSRDGLRFAPVPAIGSRPVTGVASDSAGLWVTSTAALYRLPRSGRGTVTSAVVAPAGSRSVQAVVADRAGGAWLATEDRGVVRVRSGDVHAVDRLSGLPTSWVVAVGSARDGGVLASTLRHGVFRVEEDGTWERVDVGVGNWALTAVGAGDSTCVGTQEGAACQRVDGHWVRFVGLPDPRVHLVAPVEGWWLVGTEAGVALYSSLDSAQ